MTGIIFLLYGLIVLLILGPYRIFNFFYLSAGLCLILFAGRWNRINERMNRGLAYVLLCIAILFAIVEAIIIIYAKRPAERGADYVIILGSQIREDGPSLDYQARLDSAFDYYGKNRDATVICTGAQGPSEPLSEAQGGANYLIKKGIPKEKILIEDRSFNTYQNLKNAAGLISETEQDLSKTKTVIVSASYHLYRASLLAKHIGFGQVSAKGSHGLWILQPHYYTREFFALGKELFTILR